MNVLIVHPGDAPSILFATPLIRCLRRQLKASVSCLTSATGAMVLEGNPYLSEVVTRQEALTGAAFDVVLHLERGMAPAGGVSAGDVVTVKRRRLWDDLVTRVLTARVPATEHTVQRYLESVRHLGVTDDGAGLDCFIADRNEVSRDWLPEDFQKNFVVACLSAPYATRKLPVERMIELCDRINKPVILLGEAGDAAAGDSIQRFFARSAGSDEMEPGLRELNKKTMVFNGCGKFNLMQQASVIRQARAVFAFDSVYIAMASAFGKEVITVWGNTVPRFGDFPYQTRFTVLENNRLSCRPCARGGFARCPLGHFKCMNEVNLDFFLP